ncbi:MAG: glycosyltransferase family 9 protein, partial [Gammaproteobacteria bacterium]|nr:glycosyltransferase family 9 protein [Gammaproteobacteria bacterium]
VDVLLAPDYPEAITLLEGAPEIRRLFYRPSSWSGEKQQRPDGLNREFYDVATFTLWSLALQKFVRARRTFSFQRTQWLQEGDSACVETLAKEAGWEGPLPKPFVIPANRQFDLLPDTIALHPGAKPNWPWKRWHGFEELAGLLPEVAIIGTAADLQNETTYFRRSFRWPDHVRNFVGTLSLQDTTALLRKCVALVSNDS